MNQQDGGHARIGRAKGMGDCATLFVGESRIVRKLRRDLRARCASAAELPVEAALENEADVGDRENGNRQEGTNEDTAEYSFVASERRARSLEGSSMSNEKPRPSPD
jgi:hypothetical protein